MWSFCQIFASNADKARLVTALLSVVAAVLVLVLTHALAQRRSRKELRAKKLEKIYEAFTCFADAGWKYMHERAGPGEESEQSFSTYAETHSRIDMLVSIYAKDLSERVEEMHLLVLLTKESGEEDLSKFPEKLDSFAKKKYAIQEAISVRARKLV